MSTTQHRHRSDLVRIANAVMAENGLEPEFPAAVQRQLGTLTGPWADGDPRIQDLTTLPWCSIDNDDSLDLDQLTACEPGAGGAVKVRVAVADVDALVAKGSAVDAQARMNTTSVYTSARIFPMLPQRLSNDLIEELMIATNRCTARFLAERRGASLRGVVRSPERWARIVDLARKFDDTLPNQPDARAPEGLLARRRRADPLRISRWS